MSGEWLLCRERLATRRDRSGYLSGDVGRGGYPVLATLVLVLVRFVGFSTNFGYPAPVATRRDRTPMGTNWHELQREWLPMSGEDGKAFHTLKSIRMSQQTSKRGTNAQEASSSSLSPEIDCLISISPVSSRISLAVCQRLRPCSKSLLYQSWSLQRDFSKKLLFRLATRSSEMATRVG